MDACEPTAHLNEYDRRERDNVNNVEQSSLHHSTLTVFIVTAGVPIVFIVGSMKNPGRVDYAGS